MTTFLEERAMSMSSRGACAHPVLPCPAQVLLTTGAGPGFEAAAPLRLLWEPYPLVRGL